MNSPSLPRFLSSPLLTFAASMGPQPKMGNWLVKSGHAAAGPASRLWVTGSPPWEHLWAINPFGVRDRANGGNITVSETELRKYGQRIRVTTRRGSHSPETGPYLPVEGWVDGRDGMAEGYCHHYGVPRVSCLVVAHQSYR